MSWTRRERILQYRIEDVAQYSTRAYRHHTAIGFDFGEQIVELEALSNGARTEERLYLLDLVDRDKSFFWSRTN